MFVLAYAAKWIGMVEDGYTISGRNISLTETC